MKKSYVKKLKEYDKPAELDSKKIQAAMKYYEMHDQVYRNLDEKGFISWDKHQDLGAFLSTSMNNALKYFFEQLGLSFNQINILDLGTGAGNCALFCAINGSHVVGVDVSTTALQIANRNAEELKVKASFIQADILDFNLNQKFDLIIDSSLLHCLIGIQDRSRFYSVVKSHLSNDGLLFIHTMTESSDMADLTKSDLFYLEEEILWSLGIKQIECGRKDFNGKSYFPHRTIMKKENLLKEVCGHGFELVKELTLNQARQPDTFIAIFRESIKD